MRMVGFVDGSGLCWLIRFEVLIGRTHRGFRGVRWWAQVESSPQTYTTAKNVIKPFRIPRVLEWRRPAQPWAIRKLPSDPGRSRVLCTGTTTTGGSPLAPFFLSDGGGK